MCRGALVRRLAAVVQEFGCGIESVRPDDGAGLEVNADLAEVFEVSQGFATTRKRPSGRRTSTRSPPGLTPAPTVSVTYSAPSGATASGPAEYSVASRPVGRVAGSLPSKAADEGAPDAASATIATVAPRTATPTASLVRQRRRCRRRASAIGAVGSGATWSTATGGSRSNSTLIASIRGSSAWRSAIAPTS